MILLFLILLCCVDHVYKQCTQGVLVLLVILTCAAHVLKQNTTLSELRLWLCGLRDEAICELCSGLKWCKLKKLDLGANRIRDQGAKGLQIKCRRETAWLLKLVYIGI